MIFSFPLLVTLTKSQKSLIESAVYPLRLNPFKVKILGSSHPSTYPSKTNLCNFLFERTVLETLSLENSQT